MPSREFVFNLGLSPEHAGLSPKIGSVERRCGGKRGVERGKKRRGLWLMSTRCLTFAGSHILWSSGWCVICARTYVRGDAGAAFTCRGSGKGRRFIFRTSLQRSAGMLGCRRQPSSPPPRLERLPVDCLFVAFRGLCQVINAAMWLPSG